MSSAQVHTNATPGKKKRTRTDTYWMVKTTSRGESKLKAKQCTQVEDYEMGAD